MFSVASIKRWHWLLISVAVGLALGYVNRFTSDDLASYGDGLNSQRRFEEALTRRIPDAGDVPQFMNPVVHRVHVTAGAASPSAGDVYVVSGRYCPVPWHPDPKDQKYHFRPTYFVASTPYVPVTDLGPAAEAFSKLKTPTVVDFLAALSQSQNVAYRHLWWKTYAIQLWLTASVLVLGIIWPTVVNLWLWGTWRRPAEEKGIDLSKYHPSPATAPETAPAEMTFALPDVESDDEPTTEPAPATAAASPAAPPPNLEAQPLAAAVAEARRQAEYGAKQDDFYPTEAHRPHGR